MKNKGFTLVEIVVSLALVSLMALFLTGIYLSSTKIMSNTNVANKKILEVQKVANNLNHYDSEKYTLVKISNAKMKIVIDSNVIEVKGAIMKISDLDNTIAYEIFVKE